MLTNHVSEFLARLDLPAAAQALGDAAIAVIREEMLTGFNPPIHQTGALMQDVCCTVQGSSVTIGNTLSYAPLVHDGTCRTPGRPYLSNGILNHAETLSQAVAQALRQQEA